MTDAPICFIGGGNMGAAMIGGLIASSWSRAAITVVEVSAERRIELRKLFPGVTVLGKLAACESVVIAVKPPIAAATCAAATANGARRVLSICAGVSIATLQQASGSAVSIIRAMPNMPALVGKGAAAIAGSSSSSESDVLWAESILRAVGTVVRVDESQLDAVTAISGSGPAYVFMLAECLIGEAVRQGLSNEVADSLVRQLLSGSAAMLVASGQTPAELRAQVTSPGGTTAAAIAAMEQAGFREAIVATVSAAVLRSRELRN